MVGMMLECSTGVTELLARAAFMHHDDGGHEALRYHAVLRGLMVDPGGVTVVVHLVVLGRTIAPL